MEYEFAVGRMPPISFAPATEAEEVLQNVRCLLATLKHSVPLDRDLGLSATYLDDSIEKAKGKMVSEIVLTISKYEPRATVQDISWDANIDGILTAKVKVSMDEQTQ